MPLVSIIIPTYNRPFFLRRAIRSVLNQTWQDLEIIVVNDGGMDLEGVVPELWDSKVRYIRLESNKERSVARNVALTQATGKYVSYLDDDDIFYSYHVALLVDFLTNNPKCKFVYSDAYRAHQVKTFYGWKTIRKDVPYSMDFDPVRLFINNYIPILCVMHDINILDEVGKFDESLLVLEDWDLWIRIAKRHKLFHIKRITCEFSWRSDGTTTTSAKPHEFLVTRRILWDRYRADMFRKLEQMARNGQYMEAIGFANVLIDIFPLYREYLGEVVKRILEKKA